MHYGEKSPARLTHLVWGKGDRVLQTVRNFLPGNKEVYEGKKRIEEGKFVVLQGLDPSPSAPHQREREVNITPLDESRQVFSKVFTAEEKWAKLD